MCDRTKEEKKKKNLVFFKATSSITTLKCHCSQFVYFKVIFCKLFDYTTIMLKTYFDTQRKNTEKKNERNWLRLSMESQLKKKCNSILNYFSIHRNDISKPTNK